MNLVYILFSPDDPETLCKKFQFKCCKRKVHAEDCAEKWRKLKNFMENGFLESFDAPAIVMSMHN